MKNIKTEFVFSKGMKKGNQTEVVDLTISDDEEGAVWMASSVKISGSESEEDDNTKNKIGKNDPSKREKEEDNRKEMVDLTFSDEEGEKESGAERMGQCKRENEADDCMIKSPPKKKFIKSKVRRVTPNDVKSCGFKSNATSVQGIKIYSSSEVFRSDVIKFTKITSRININEVKSICHNTRYCNQERTWKFDCQNQNFTLGICPNCGASPGHRGKISLGGHGAFVKEDDNHVRMVNPDDYGTKRCTSAYTIGVAVADGKLVVVKTKSLKPHESSSNGKDSKLPATP